MATTGIINGTNMLLYVDGTAIAGSKTCEFALTHSPRETTVKSDAGYETFGEGKRSWNGKCDGLIALDATGTTFTSLVALWNNRTKVLLKFSTEASGDKYWYGYGYLKDVSQNDPDNTSAGFSCSFEGTGSFTEGSHT
jgi:hypothetical protein